MCAPHKKLAKLGRGFFYVLIAAMLLPLLFSATAPQAAADPGWWDNNWDYRAPVTISGNHPENYQLRIVLDKADNLNNHCLDNFQDVRFLESDDSGELSFWIENYISEDNAIFWVMREENADDTIYIYYGNPDATSAENKFAVFDLYDDWDDGDITSGTVWTQVSGTTDAGAGHVVFDELDEEIGTTAVLTAGIWEWDAQIGTGDVNELDFIFMWENASNFYYVSWDTNSPTAYFNLMKTVGGSPTSMIETTWSPDTSWHSFKVTRDENGNFEIFRDGVSKGTTTNTETTISNEVRFRLPLYYAEQGANFDNLIARCYVSPEPTVSVGTEETIIPPPPTPPITEMDVIIFITPLALICLAVGFSDSVFAFFGGIAAIFTGVYYIDTIWAGMIFMGLGIYFVTTAFYLEKEGG